MGVLVVLKSATGFRADGISMDKLVPKKLLKYEASLLVETGDSVGECINCLSISGFNNDKKGKYFLFRP
jgi:hypothetical protein